MQQSAPRGERETHHFGPDPIHTVWDAALPPRLTIHPGDTVVAATIEGSWGDIARNLANGAAAGGTAEIKAYVAASASPPPAKGAGTELSGHALTGPIAIAGAEPGDTLVVEILNVVTGDWGWTVSGPTESALLHDELTGEVVVHIWDLRDGTHASFLPGITIPLAPFCGVMGVAPAAPGPHSTIPPRAVGGNLDVRQLVAGATLFLPVEVPGALFSVGDAHGAQGDGEVSGTAIETGATVTLRFGLRKGEHLHNPRYLTPSLGNIPGPWFAATGIAADLREAARAALRDLLAYLQAEHGLTQTEANTLASVCADLRINQTVNGGVYTVSALLPLSIFTAEAAANQ